MKRITEQNKAASTLILVLLGCTVTPSKIPKELHKQIGMIKKSILEGKDTYLL